MEAGYNQDTDNVMQQAACSALDGWSCDRLWSTAMRKIESRSK